VQLNKFRHIRFLGAEGIGMRALQGILQDYINQNILITKISKSDLAYKQNDELSQDIDLVVKSTAIKDQDEELVELKQRQTKVIHRSEMLNLLSEKHKQIVISGTHGKTTCSAITAFLLDSLGVSCGFAIGGLPANFSVNGRAGNSEYFVLEGDESDKSFMRTKPYIALVTDIEADHLENYPGGFEEIKSCFYKFLDSASYKVICLNSKTLREYYERCADKSSITVYTSDKNIKAKNYSAAKAFFQIDTLAELHQIYYCNESGAINKNKDVLKNNSHETTTKLQTITLTDNLLGAHNLLNAAGCLGIINSLGLDIKEAAKALTNFKGISRRFELINDSYQINNLSLESKDIDHKSQTINSKSDNYSQQLNDHNQHNELKVKVYDDYAHHPTEISALKAGIESIIKPTDQVVFVYQPHHPERTQQFWEDFISAFQDFKANFRVVIVDVYIARSKNIAGINSKRLASEIARPNVSYLASQSNSELDIQGNFKDTATALKPAVDKVLIKAAESLTTDAELYLFLVGAGNIAKLARAYR
jgi:UDP-N-acetylmuramate--alanine ligase